MKNSAHTLLMASIAVVGASICVGAEENAQPALAARPSATVELGETHRFIAGLFRQGKAAMISEAGKIEWEIPARCVQDIWILPNGNLLLSHLHGAREINLDDKTVAWEYTAPEKVEVHSCQPLPGGDVLLGECGTSRLVEVGRDGKINKQIKLKTSVKNAHVQFRCCRKTARGTYLVAFAGESVVKELDAAGKVIRRIAPEQKPCKAGAHAVVRLPNGNTLISTGYNKSVVEIDPQGKTVWRMGREQLSPQFDLHYVAGIQRLPNGNTVIANYAGTPQFFEVTPKYKVVWQVNDPKLSAVAGHLILDVEGEPLR